MTEHPPQRFRWRTRGYARWKYGCCVHLPTWERWEINTFGLEDPLTFDSDPWEIIGHIIGDAAEFQWIDNDLNWQGDVIQRKTTMTEKPQPGEIWRHKESEDECLFIGRCRDGQMVWQCDGDTVETGDLDWTGWERVSVVVPRVANGWLTKDCDGLMWFRSKPKFEADIDAWIFSASSNTGQWYETAESIIDPWHDQENGGPECILEVH